MPLTRSVGTAKSSGPVPRPVPLMLSRLSTLYCELTANSVAMGAPRVSGDRPRSGW